jgi:DNA-binding XRE family transcriptional regulator
LNDRAKTSEEQVMATLARTVRAARGQRGWSQDQLSAHAGVSKGALVALENASTNPNLSTLCRLSDALRLPVATLLGQMPSPGVEIVAPDAPTPLWRGPAGGTAALVLVTGGAAPVELWHWSIHEGEAYDHVPYPPGLGVTKTVTVTTGELRLTVDGTDHHVVTGATATFSGASAHRFEGATSHCEALATTHLPIGGAW